MEIKVNKNQDVLTVSPVGRVDSVTTNELDEKIKNHLSSEIKILALDFAEVSFISSKGIRILLSYHREMQTKGKLVIKNINNSIKEVLRLSALLDVFNIE